MSAEDDWVQVGWMPSPELAAEWGIGPLDDEWLSSVEMAEDQGGVKPEYADRLVPVYARREDNARETTPMSTPRRIQRKRSKGWRMPAGAIYVGRPTKWGNPFQVGKQIPRDSPLFGYVRVPGGTAGFSSICMNRAEDVVDAHFYWLMEQPALMLAIEPELRGHDLVCWCGVGLPCHADVLLELANADDAA